MYYNSSTKWSCLRGNRTANIVATRTMLADSKLPTTFWAEVVKPHNKTPYKLFHGRTPTLSFMRPFRCPVTILNTIDHLGKFGCKADEEFFVGYSINSKASIETVPGKDYILLPLWTVDPPFSQSSKSSPNDGSKPSSDDGKKVDENPRKESEFNDQEKEDDMDINMAFPLWLRDCEEEVYVFQPQEFEEQTSLTE
ncbi:ribonuclease H-like domain-containing protein [Tanacetum coccineum]